MFTVIKVPVNGTPGTLRVDQTCRVSDAEAFICRLGHRVSTHNDISPRDAANTPVMAIAIGSKVQHPERAYASLAYLVYDRKGKKVHVLVNEGSLLPEMMVFMSSK